MDDLTRRALVGGLAMSGAGCLASSGGTRALLEAPLAFVHPELRAIAAAMLKPGGTFPDPTRETLAAARAAVAAQVPPPLASPAFSRQFIKGPTGAPDVPIHIINAAPGASRPAIVHMHGGGFISGLAASMVAQLQAAAAALDCVIVSVDYRLAPETLFSGSIEDNYAALKWVHDNARELGVDRGRIAVMGESAGGGHAAMLAITARDRGEVPLVLQVLLYPMLDDRTGSVRHPVPPNGTIMWTASKNSFGWECFLGQTPGTAHVPSRAVPARLADLKGSAPAFIGVGSIDLLADESIIYGRRLIDDEVPVELIVVPGAFHAFDRIASTTTVAKRFTSAKLEALRQAFSQPA